MKRWSPDSRIRLTPVFRDWHQFTIQFSGAGTFPSGRPARVAWIGLDRPDSVVALAGVIRNACEGLYERAENKPFTPHVTVGRCRRPWSRSVVERWQSAFQGAVGDEFAVVRTVLMRSWLSPEGARWKRYVSLGSTVGAVAIAVLALVTVDAGSAGREGAAAAVAIQRL